MRIFNEGDCLERNVVSCLANESFAFQVLVKSSLACTLPIKIESVLETNCYLVKKIKGVRPETAKKDDYYVISPDDMYPELLKKVDSLTLKTDDLSTLFIEIPASEKQAGEYKITVRVGEESVDFILKVKSSRLVKSDLYLTNWFHIDGICNRYQVVPFSEEFYGYFSSFLTAYIIMGNNMLLTPLFTPPLDTAVGSERLTVQLVDVEKREGKYFFEFSQLKKFMNFCKEHGVEYFELSHLFSQWGVKRVRKLSSEKTE